MRDLLKILTRRLQSTAEGEGKVIVGLYFLSDPTVIVGHSRKVIVLEGHGKDQFGFYPHDVYVSAVLATATWVAGCLSHAGIVSKRLKIS